jgi:hypothetical protein
MARNSSTGFTPAAQVAEDALPGWRVVQETTLDPATEVLGSNADSPDDSAADGADSVMPSMEKLKAKYLGAGQADSAGIDAVTDNTADTTLVELESGPLKKTVAVSKSKKKVIWSQG